MRTRIKICGITRVEDALAAAHAGTDAIGLIFYPGSARAVNVAQAQSIVSALPPFITPVALFVNADEQDVRSVIAAIKPGLLQFHGDETEAFCNQFDMPYIRAVRVGQGVDLLQLQHEF